MEIRAYTPADREGCLTVLESVALDRREPFESYLDGETVFFVAEHDGAIVGCGGVETSATAARLVWGMVRRDMQRMGLGRFLLMYRFKEITRRASVEFVSATVPETAKGFYAKQGFRESPGAAGEMTKRLSVCA